MNILFIHQNFPGQFRHLAPALAQRGHRVVATLVGPDSAVRFWQGVELVPYQIRGRNIAGLHPWLVDMETKVHRAEACWHAARGLRARGFQPDLIVAHMGWGEALLVKRVWPHAKVALYAEFFYRMEGADVGFDAEFAASSPDEDACRLQLKNLNHLAHLDQADAAISPTQWQASTFPSHWRERIKVIHDGIDTDTLAPLPDAQLPLPSGQVLTREDEVLTYVSRHLEPYRGFHVFMRSLPELLRARPQAQVVIVGEDGTGYGAAAPVGKTWRCLLSDEVRPQISKADWARVHFVGRLNRKSFTRLLQVSRLHVYLSYPFVLSWSLLEAMSVGCCVVASDTAPVREVLTDREHGCLVDFFSRQNFLERAVELLDSASLRQQLGTKARQHVVEHYDLRRTCLPAQIAWVEGGLK